MVRGKVGTAGLRGDSRSLTGGTDRGGVEVSRSAERGMRPGAPVPPPEGHPAAGASSFWICPLVTSAKTFVKHSAPLLAQLPTRSALKAGFRSQNASRRGGKDQFAKRRRYG